ncbi:4'-phosphopantetheinyl transferase [Oxalobacteraceae bacterium GrIS 1.11]
MASHATTSNAVPASEGLPAGDVLPTGIASKPHPMRAQASVRVCLVDATRVREADLLALLARLGAAETARYRRFVRPQRQRQFLLGRILLRQAMGQLLGLPSEAFGLTERPGQAPLLTLADTAIPMPFFSLSHSGDWVACALGADCALGLDIEVLDPARDLLALARQAFGVDDAERLAALPGDSRLLAFYGLWSEQEARYKLGPCAAPACVKLAHPALSIVVCSARPLASPPSLILTTLDP